CITSLRSSGPPAAYAAYAAASPSSRASCCSLLANASEVRKGTTNSPGWSSCSAAVECVVMGRVVYFDCPSGASGDMILGALVDVGVEVGVLCGELEKLRVGGGTLVAREVRRGGGPGPEERRGLGPPRPPPPPT